MHKITFSVLTFAAVALLSCGSQSNELAAQNLSHEVEQNADAPVVLMTTDISAESLVRIYEQLGVKAEVTMLFNCF